MMSAPHFFLAKARAQVAETIAAVELQTAAEVVVTVRRRSGNYRHVDLYAGAVCAFLALVVLLFAETEFEIVWMPLETAAAFAFGAFTMSSFASLRRRFTSRRLLHGNVRAAAHASFYELGISRTRGRTGILVYVSIFERAVEVVPDIGVDPASLGAEWAAAVAELSAAVRARADFDRFLAALRALAGPLSRALPARPDDTDELPNEPVTA